MFMDSEFFDRLWVYLVNKSQGQEFKLLKYIQSMFAQPQLPEAGLCLSNTDNDLAFSKITKLE